jgi:tRNA G18 (ribose-2'-O)-methylase SpoU
VPVIRLADASDPRVAAYAGVRDPGLLSDQSLLIAEGRFVVRRALASTRIRVRSLLVNQAAFASLRDVLDTSTSDLDVFVAPPEVITAATGFNLHRGCLALAERPRRLAIDDVLAAAKVIVLLERVVDPDNVGSVFRSAEAFGADAVLLSSGCADPFYRKAIRTSSGAALVVPWATAEPWPDALRRIGGAGFRLVALTPDSEAMPIGDWVASAEARGRVALLLGTEGQGLSADALALGDRRVRIPMSGALDSLNIATAAGIALQRIHEAK